MKGFGKGQEFRPTPAMELFAYQRAKLGNDATQVDLSERIGVNPATVSRWKQQQGFAAWLDEAVACYRSPILEMLEQVALQNIRDYRYWEALAIKYGYITKTQLPKDKDDEESKLQVLYAPTGEAS